MTRNRPSSDTFDYPAHLALHDFIRAAGPSVSADARLLPQLKVPRSRNGAGRAAALGPTLPSRRSVGHGSYQGTSCRPCRWSTTGEFDPDGPSRSLRVCINYKRFRAVTDRQLVLIGQQCAVGHRRRQISKALLIAIGSDFDLLAMLK
jgi:hypothetical protein